jgi:hypothetical protein
VYAEPFEGSIRERGSNQCSLQLPRLISLPDLSRGSIFSARRKTMDERRAFFRNDVRIEAKVIAPDMSCCVDCVIMNLSEDGALVSMRGPARVPQRAYLWQAQTGTLFECEVRWRKNDRLFGLYFVDAAGRSRRRALIEASSGDAQSSARIAPSGAHVAARRPAPDRLRAEQAA